MSSPLTTQDATGTVERRVRERHSSMNLVVHAGDAHGAVCDFEDGTVGHKRSRVSIGAEAEVRSNAGGVP